MAPPRSAFGASPPGGPSPDTRGPVDLSCLARSRAARHGAACKAPQRPGKAGSAASAWLRRTLLCGLVAIGLPAAAAGRTPLPTIERAQAGTQCVEPAADMRRNHMRYLKHQRDDTVHGGIRGARHSLKGCIDCHASVQTASVAKAESNFCVSCHSYAAVHIDCFECHTSVSPKLAQGVAK